MDNLKFSNYCLNILPDLADMLISINAMMRTMIDNGFTLCGVTTHTDNYIYHWIRKDN